MYAIRSYYGHLDHAAGMAGLIKAVLALKNKKIPPNIHFNMPNRKINFEESPVYINDRLKEWETNGFPRKCGISSFGLSGTNVHVVLEEAPAIADEEGVKQASSWQVLTFSAKEKNALRKSLSDFYEYVENAGRITSYNVCYTKLLRGCGC